MIPISSIYQWIPSAEQVEENWGTVSSKIFECIILEQFPLEDLSILQYLGVDHIEATVPSVCVFLLFPF